MDVATLSDAGFAWLGALVCGAFAVSALLTWFAIHYARRHRLIDLPGQRRSHTLPTPRGGGIGIAASALLSTLALAGWSPFRIDMLGLPAAIAVVALAGGIDDHRGLNALVRFVMHGIAALLVLGSTMLLGLVYLPRHDVLPYAVVCLAALLAVVWSINLHNFMDGIDGLLAMQALFVFAVLAVLFADAGEAAETWRVTLYAVAVAGFMPFNFPRARVFMGDVGSGVLGLLIAIAVLWQMTTPAIALCSGIVLCSAFVTDATCTLLSRMLRGRRWYSAHREHLYQWLVRCGHSHVQVVALYMGWNIVIVLPVVYWMNRMARAHAAMHVQVGGASAVYALAIVVWWLGKRLCLRTVAKRRTRAAA
jgi:UDP-N-acetylmuramyl pentapeptide phosphotransferase/UDP-N-acetylglucosamine-1-phosphate transferase